MLFPKFFQMVIFSIFITVPLSIFAQQKEDDSQSATVKQAEVKQAESDQAKVDQAAVDQVRSALDDVTRLLDDQPHADSWRKYLYLEELATEFGGEQRPDVPLVAKVIRRLEADAPGLDRPGMQHLREALWEWYGKQAQPSFEELAESIRTSAQTVRNMKPDGSVITQEQIAKVRKNLNTALEQLQEHLADLEDGGTLSESLQLTNLEAELDKNEPDGQALYQVWQAFMLEPQTVNDATIGHVQGYLQTYIEMLDARSKPDFPQQLAGELDELADALATYPDNPSASRAGLIGRLADRLSRLRQVPAVARMVRLRFGGENMLLDISERLVSSGMSREVDEEQAVRDVILGTQIRGESRTHGKIQVRFVPNRSVAEFETYFTGQADSKTVGYNGPARIGSRGVTKLEAYSHLRFTPTGLQASSTEVDARTHTRGTGISTDHSLGSRFIQGIASRRSAQQRPQADRIASRKAERRFAKTMDERTEELVQKTNDWYVRFVRKPLLTRGEFPRLFRTFTSEDNFGIRIRYANALQLAAAGSPPEVSEPNDLALRIHESAINNIATSLLAGQTLREEKIRQELEDLLGEVPQQFQSDEEHQPWEITFQRNRPLSVAFRDGKLRITLRGRRYTTSERDVRSMDVTAVYTLERAGNGMRATREGELDIVPARITRGANRQFSAGEIAQITALEKRMANLFEAEYVSEGFKLPEQWEQTEPLQLQQVESQNGWLVLAWRMPEKKAE